MKLFIVGINHKTAPVEVREKVSFSPHEAVRANQLLKERTRLEEGLILSTCNRVEIYAVANTQKNIDYVNEIKHFLSEFHNIDPTDFENRLYIHSDEEAVKHLFRVASGLDSMVIGETEILGQVKKAYQDAREGRTAGRVLNRLLQQAFNTAKRIRTETFVSRGVVSVSSVAVRLAKKVLGNLQDKKVLIVGTGKIGEQLVLYFKDNGIKSILVTNRTFEKAHTLAGNFGAEAVRFENFWDRLTDVDIVIASTGASHCIIRKQEVLELMPKRRQRPLLIIDLAVPRDVEAEVNKIDNVYLYDIDDLQKIVDKNIALRQSELDNCKKIIDASCQKFIERLTSARIGNGE